jgi:hypothetical protein
MFQKLVQLLIVTLITFMVSYVDAQDTLTNELLAPPGTMLPLLQIDEFQKEIKLNVEQKEKINAFVRESKDIQKLPSKDRNAQSDILEGKIKKLLLPTQIERLNQFYLQLKGASVLPNDRVQKLLVFTAEQKNKLANIHDAESKKVFEAFRSGYNRQDQEMRKRRVNMINEWHAKMMDVLTPDQKKKLETMKGKNFAFDVSKIDI